MDNERYLYEVRPRKPVRIPGQRATLARRSLQLTKEEVKEYLKSGPVYRKSVKGELIQVTGGTLEKLHAQFGSWNVETRAPTSQTSIPSTHTENRSQHTYQQGNSNHQRNKPDKKDKRHQSNGDNYRGDDRGKAVTNGSVANPQYNNGGNNQEQSYASSMEPAPVVNLP